MPCIWPQFVCYFTFCVVLSVFYFIGKLIGMCNDNLNSTCISSKTLRLKSILANVRSIYNVIL